MRNVGIGCACVATALLIITVFPLPGDVLINLVLGWVFFIVRIATEVHPGWAGIATALICLIGFTAGLHAFLRWLSRERGAVYGSTSAPWKWQWTRSAVAVIVLMFVAGLSTVGVSHHAGWLLVSNEPLINTGGVLMRRMQSRSNLKQMGLALNNYHAQHYGFPPGGSFGPFGQPLHGWQAMILPFAEARAVYDQINFALPWDDPRNVAPFQSEVQAFSNPEVLASRHDDAGYALSGYAANGRVIGTSHALSEIKDGASVTILAGEAAGDYKPWGSPTNWRDPALGINRTSRGFGSPAPGGAQMLFADGSVKWIRDTTSPRVLEALSTPDGGETVRADDF
jgi:prepilin-type processing-associated H-X9-DG protein